MKKKKKRGREVKFCVINKKKKYVKKIRKPKNKAKLSMKVKSVKTRILEEVGFLLPTKKLLSSKEKVEIMEQFLMMPASQIVTLQQDGRKPTFVQQIAKLLYNNNLGEYFDVLKMCRDMAVEEEENKGAFKDDPQVRAEFMNLVNGDKYEG